MKSKEQIALENSDIEHVLVQPGMPLFDRRREDIRYASGQILPSLIGLGLTDDQAVKKSIDCATKLVDELDRRHSSPKLNQPEPLTPSNEPSPDTLAGG